MHILIISASMRASSESLKVAEYLAARQKAQGGTAEIVDLHTLALPSYNDEPTEDPSISTLLAALSAADGYVFISPEWNGMLSYGLVNMLLYVGKEMADKPVLLAGVSNTRGGFYPIAQMQQIGQKNRFYVILPEHLVISNVESFMNDPTQEPTEYIEKRAHRAMGILNSYAAALKTMRETAPIDYSEYKNGM